MLCQAKAEAFVKILKHECLRRSARHPSAARCSAARQPAGTICRSDNTLLLLNGLLLMGITVVPFPTALLAAYIGHPDEQVAPLVYGGTLVLIAIFFNVLWLYASHGRRLLDRKADEGSVRAITRQYRVGPLLYLAGFLLAFVNVPLSIGTYLLLALYFALPGSAIDRARG